MLVNFRDKKLSVGTQIALAIKDCNCMEPSALIRGQRQLKTASHQANEVTHVQHHSQLAFTPTTCTLPEDSTGCVGRKLIEFFLLLLLGESR